MPDRGLTLVELLVTLAVAAILVTVAVPSYTAFVRDTRLTSQANRLVSSINLTRSEAARRGQSVQLVSESGDTDFAAGWRIQVAATGEDLRVVSALEGGNSLTGTDDSVLYLSTGYPESTESFDLCSSDGSGEGRLISIQPSGRAEIATLACP